MELDINKQGGGTWLEELKEQRQEAGKHRVGCGTVTGGVFIQKADGQSDDEPRYVM